MAWCKDKGFEPDAVWKKEPSAIVKQMQEKAGWQIVRVEIRKFSPSGTGAAEPIAGPLNIDPEVLRRDALLDAPRAAEMVAVCPSCGWRFHPEVATPPVRGDREIIRAFEDVCEKIAATRPQAAYLAMIDGGQGDLLTELDEVPRRARDILSLPIQSTARPDKEAAAQVGERDAKPDLCAGGVKPGWDECPKCGATMDDECKAPRSTAKTCLDDIGLKITNELYKAVSGHTGDACLLAMIGSWGDTLNDADILAGLQR